MFIQNYYLRFVFNLILFCSVLYLFSYVISRQHEWIFSSKYNKANHITGDISQNLDEKEEITQKNEQFETTPETTTIKKDNDPLVKNRFENIYKNRIWSDLGGGSGAGSTINYTDSVRSILREVINEYSIESMLDAPCGSFIWMPLMLRNVSEDFKTRGKRFRYHGVDVVESIIKASKEKYSNESDWDFSVCDFSSQDLPNGYDLVFSRDALQHLSYEKVSLRCFNKVFRVNQIIMMRFLL